MKKILFVLVTCVTLSHAQSPEVTTEVLQYRRSYRVPAIPGTPRMTLTLGFTPPSGYVLREQAEWDTTIKGTDEAGQSIECSASSLSLMPNAPGCAQTELSLRPHPKGKWVRLHGTAHLTLATGTKLQPRHRLDLTTPSHFTLGGITFTATPSQANTAKDNIENGKLHTAELTLTYPSNVHILHISRIWSSADMEETSIHRQELSTTGEKNEKQQNKLHITLWDADPTETIEIVTCNSMRQINTPIDIHLTLGGDMSTQTHTPTSATK